MLQVGALADGGRQWMLNGGMTFESGEQQRRLERDGGTTPQAGDTRPVGWEARFRFRLKDFTIGMPEIIHAGAASDGSSQNATILPKARTPYTDNDLITDVRMIFRVLPEPGGTERVDAICFPLATVEPYTMSGEDKNEIQREISLLATLPGAEDPNTCPFVYIENYDITNDTYDVADYWEF